MRGGLPSFYRQGLSSIATIILNVSVGPYGDAAIAAMFIVTRLMQFALSTLLGFGQGFQPVCGFNYGAKKYHRVLVVIGVIGFINAPSLIGLFRKDAEVIRIGTRAHEQYADANHRQGNESIIVSFIKTRIILYSYYPSHR